MMTEHVAALRALFRLFLGTASSKFRVGGIVCIGAVAVAVAWRLGTRPETDELQRAASVADIIGISLLAPLASLIFGTAMFGDLADDQTLVYLWLRPTPRFIISVAAHGAALMISLPAVMIPALGMQLALGAPLRMVLAVVVATAGATIAGTAVFVALGLITRRALIWGIGYVLIAEQFLARGGSGLGSISIRSAAMSIITNVTGTDSAVAWFGTPRAVVMLIVVAVLARATTVVALLHKEVA